MSNNQENIKYERLKPQFLCLPGELFSYTISVIRHMMNTSRKSLYIISK